MTYAHDLSQASPESAVSDLLAVHTATEGVQQDSEDQGSGNVPLTDQEREMVEAAWLLKHQVCSIMRNHGFSGDDVEDAFIAACVRVRTIRDPKALKSQLFRATKQVLIDQHRKGKGDRALVHSLNWGVPEEFPAWFAPFVGSDPRDTHDTFKGSPTFHGGQYGSLIASEMINTLEPEIESILRCLPKHYRKVLVARVAFDTDEEAANALGMTKPRYKSLLYRARRDARRAAGME